MDTIVCRDLEAVIGVIILYYLQRVCAECVKARKKAVNGDELGSKEEKRIGYHFALE